MVLGYDSHPSRWVLGKFIHWSLQGLGQALTQARSHTSHAGIRVQCKVSHPSLQDPREGPIPYSSCVYILDATLIGTRISLFVFGITRTARWPIWSCFGSKLRATGFKSWSGRMFVIGGCAYTVFQTVERHGVCSDVYGTVRYKKSLEDSYSIRVGHSPFLL